MDFRGEALKLLDVVGIGSMPSTAYDTAWLARLTDVDSALSQPALEWLKAHQLTDGSWGAEKPLHRYDRVISTLAAVIALARAGGESERVEMAKRALENHILMLSRDPYETIGFELIAPTLLAEASRLGVELRCAEPMMERLCRQRERKLAVLPRGTISRHTTVAFSAEMAGDDEARLLADDLQEANGSVACSPSATAYLLLRRRDRAAQAYLHTARNFDRGVPDVAPFDEFEIAWTLWNLDLSGLLSDPLSELGPGICNSQLNFLETGWVPDQGAGFAAGYSVKDADGTALVLQMLMRFGREPERGLETLLRYEAGDHFRCFDLEANPSISANVHVLDTLLHLGLADHPAIHKIIDFLLRARTCGMFWFDKWHMSPYYATSHAVIALAKAHLIPVVRSAIEDAVFFLENTQNADGSWGYADATAEETAYALQALAVWRHQGGKVDKDVFRRGESWLAAHADPPYLPLWIGKCLYCPETVVRSAIVSALALVSGI